MTAAATSRSVPLEVRAIGNVQPLVSVTVKPQVSGELAEVYFQEGQDVKTGHRLFRIDPRPFQAELSRAEAALAKDLALLEAAQRDEGRYRELVQRGLVAPAQYDQVRASAGSLAATVKADRAVVENARLQLGYTQIRAPTDGRTGAVLVRPGNLVTASQTALVVINQVSPITVAFALPESQLGDVRAYQRRGTLKVAAAIPGPPGEPASGELTFIDNRVDPATGTIQLKATFANDDARLWPGQFVNVVLTLGIIPDAVVVPSAAVQMGQEGRYVFVVKPDRTAELRPVEVAREVGGETVIARGVAPGEVVVTDGQLRVVPGARLEAKTPATDAPAASPRSP